MSHIILIADDEPWQRMWMSHVLHKAGYMCSTVVDGADVVEQALALNPHLVILDVEMPGVSGIEAAEQLRILPNTAHLPILFVTSHASSHERHRQSTPDRTEWLRKPFQPNDLLMRIERLLR